MKDLKKSLICLNQLTKGKLTCSAGWNTASIYY